MQVRFTCLAQQFEIRSDRRFPDEALLVPGTSDPITWDQRPTFDADRETLQHVLRDCAPSRLRGLLDADQHAIWRLNDTQVVDHIVDHLCNGSLALFEARRMRRSVGSLAGGFGGGQSSEFVTPSRLRPSPGAVATPAIVAEARELAADLDDDVQAATLLEAAKYGLPLCEECVRQRAELAS